jgi:hypothetical protein
MMDWLLNLIPWWAYLIAGAVAVVAVWRLLGWQSALAALAGLVAILGYGKGRNDAYRDAQGRSDQNNLKASRNRKEIDDEIDQLGSNDIDERLSRWLRDDDAG